MLIDIASPASLPLCLTQTTTPDGWTSGVLVATLQHPPVQLQAGSHARFAITGPRSDRAIAYARAIHAAHDHAHAAVVEIELAIPQYMGLASDTMLALSIARALAWINDADPLDTPALARIAGLRNYESSAMWGFDRGGLLAVGFGREGGNSPARLLRRSEVQHAERDAWAFVLYLPRVDDTASAAASELWTQWRAAAQRLDGASAQSADERLWSAVEADNLQQYAESLAELCAISARACVEAGFPQAHSSQEDAVFDVMRAEGALAVGRSMGGRAQWALVHGGDATRNMRKQIQHHVGYDAGRAMATVVDNRGAYHVVKDATLNPLEQYPIRPRSDLGTRG